MKTTSGAQSRAAPKAARKLRATPDAVSAAVDAGPIAITNVMAGWKTVSTRATTPFEGDPDVEKEGDCDGVRVEEGVPVGVSLTELVTAALGV